MVVHRANGEDVLLEHTGPALGLAEHADFTEHRLTLQEGDRLILYSDGLLDRFGSGSKAEILDLVVPALTGDARDGPRRLRGLFEDVDRRARDGDNGFGRDDVTLLMLQVDGGPSSFDNEPGDEKDPPPSETSTSSVPACILWIAENEEETHLAVRGHGSWLNCETFRRLAQAAGDAGRRLAIDLADCAHLDSAFLGTLHEVVTDRPEGQVSVHSPSGVVRALFTELGLARVLHAIHDEPDQPPCKPALVRQDPPARESQQRLLRAHEILSELSEENRQRFAGVLQALRAELGDDT